MLADRKKSFFNVALLTLCTLEIKPFGLGSRIRDMEAESHN